MRRQIVATTAADKLVVVDKHFADRSAAVDRDSAGKPLVVTLGFVDSFAVVDKTAVD